MMKVVKGPEDYQERYEPGAMAGATKAVAGIGDCITIMHGVQGCTVAGNHLRSGGPAVDGNYMRIIECNLGLEEVILGGNEELILRHARRFLKTSKTRPKLIFLFTSCAPSIIEDDIQRAATLMEAEFGIPVIARDTAAFLGGFNRGAETAWCAVLDRFPPVSSEKRGINLAGPQLMGSRNWPHDIDEIVRLVKAAGVEVNHVLFRHIGVDQLPEIGQAEASYILCGEEFPKFEKKAASLGMKTWGQDLVLPVGVHNTEEWYLTLARQFGNEQKAREQLHKDMKRVKDITQFNFNSSWALNGMFGKHIAILGYAPFVAALARCAFYDFNLRPTVVGLFAETPAALQRAEKLLEPMSEYLDFEVLENPSYFLYGQKLKEAQVEFAIGLKQDETLVEGLGIHHISLGGFYYFNNFNFVPWPYFGILGVLNLMSELWRGTYHILSETRVWQASSYEPRQEAAVVSEVPD